MKERYTKQVRLHLTPDQMERLEKWGNKHSIDSKSDVMRRFIRFGMATIADRMSKSDIFAYHSNGYRGHKPLGFTAGMLFMVTPQMKSELTHWAYRQGLHAEEAMRAFVDFGLAEHPNQLTVNF